jgi:hypothetical protein
MSERGGHAERNKAVKQKPKRKPKVTVVNPGELVAVPVVGLLFDRSLVERLMTIDMFYRKYGVIRLLRHADLLQLAGKLRGMYIDGACYASNDSNRRVGSQKSFLDVASELSDAAVFGKLENNIPMLRKIFQVGEGHIVIAGGSLSTIAALSRIPNFYHSYEDVDIFFYGFKCEDDATQCLKRLVNVMFEGNRPVGFKRSKHALTLQCVGADIQFILRLYDTKEQILAGFDLSSSQILFDTDFTFQATLAGAIFMITGFSYVDMGKRSISYSSRLTKYVHNKAAIFLFPGLAEHPRRFETPDGNFILEDDEKTTFRYVLEWRRGQKSESDYDADDYMNWWYIKTGKLDKLCLFHFPAGKDFKAEDVFLTTSGDIVKSLSCKTMRPPMNDDYRRRQEKTRKKQTLLLLFGEKAEEFMIAYYIKEDKEKVRSMWEEMTKSYIKVMTEQTYLYNIEWNVKDPGTQRFGQVNPIIADPREWYGKDYFPTYAGIQRDVLKTLFGLKRDHPLWKMLPQDVFRYILKHIIALQIRDTYKMLGL